MNNCNLTDQAAALLVQSTLSKDKVLKKLDFSGIEMGPKFIEAMKNAFTENPNCLEALILTGVKPVVSMGALSEAIILSKNLTYLDIRANNINAYAVDRFTKYLVKTEVLEYLNVSQCQLWDKVCEKVIDALMLNKSVKYLDMSHNRFSSKDYIIAAKVGRLVQGHPELLHVDISHC